MAELKPWQVKAIDAYVGVCGVDEHGIAGPWFGPELEQLLTKVCAESPWRELLSRWDLKRTVIWLLSRKTTSLQKDYVGLLSAAPDGAKLKDQFKDELVGFLESLPRLYYVYFPLVSVPALGRTELKISDSVSIIDTSVPEGLDSRLLLGMNAQLVQAMGGGIPPKLSRDARYVRFQLSGYADGTIVSPVASSALAQLKHFLFICLARKVLEETPSWQYQDVTAVATVRPPAVAAHVSLSADEQYALTIPEELYRFLYHVKLNRTTLTYYDTSQGLGLLLGKQRQAETPEEIAWAIPQSLGKGVEFLAIPRDDPDAIRIKAAIEWWIDGVVGQNQTISFLQFCIGFEALLGDSAADAKKSRERGITERLADRFAYLRGRTQTERDALRKEFIGVYDRRGTIVHQREVHLRQGEDFEACQNARRMLFAAIADELNALMDARKP